MNTRQLWFPVLLAVMLLMFSAKTDAQNHPFSLKIGPQPDGSVLVPSNQLLRPAGSQIEMPGRPVDMTLLSHEQFLLVKNMKSLELIRLSDKKILQTLPFGKGGSSFTGICASVDSKHIYLTEATGKVLIAGFDSNNKLSWESEITMPKPSIGDDPAPGGLALNKAEDRLFVTLSRNNSLAVVNLKDQSIREIPVGIAPYDVSMTDDSKAYVTNWGGRRPVEGESTYNTSGSQVLVDPVTGVANNGSVSVIDIKSNKSVKEINVGLHPCGMTLSADKSLLYVACANSDQIFVIDTKKEEVKTRISVHLKKETLFGSAPNALALSPDGKYLYAANGTDNALCVIETAAPNRVAGYIPTGWYPGAVIMNGAGTQLYVANVKGVGSRNKGAGKAGYNSHDHLGSVSVIPVPDQAALPKMTDIVEQNNNLMKSSRNQAAAGNIPATSAVPLLPSQKSPIKHVLYIIKENRTYDQIFGDMKQGDGDTSLVLFGRETTPNHHKLAEKFVLLDNFYCSGVLSADGHQWTDEAYVTDYLEKSFGNFTRSYPYDGGDALAYASTGFIWDNVLRNKLTFRNYGEFVNAEILPKPATFSAIYKDFQQGTKNFSIRAIPNIEQIKPYTCPTFVGFPINVPDVYRAGEFIKELRGFEKTGNLPNFMIMLLPADHTSGTRPGLPTPRAAVADNDLALGQIVEAISNSQFWKETCIFVTEDDPQAGLDHVDGHRTVGMVISPYTKHKEVVSTYYSQINMVRTIENILGIPPMNQLDNASEPMSDCFQDKPDFTPYKAERNIIPLDELNPPISRLSGKKLSWAKKSLEQDLDDYDRIDEDIFNRIIWHSVKGYDRPYPEITLKE
ncbi:MAG: bifunctional YncE family protein/alkaline phosphatase family protein [Prolixibacteraceae bacterium]